MKLSTFSFEPAIGWSLKEFPPMDSEQTLVIVFAAPEYLDQPSALWELFEAYPQATIVGCSTGGEIIGALVNDASLSVAVLQFERTKVEAVSAKIERPEDSFAVGAELARKLNSRQLAAVFVLSDGLHVNGSELVKGLGSALAPGVVVTGGLAGDGDRFERTWVISERRPQGGMATAVGLYGKRLRVTHGSRGGWDSFGLERRVTRSSGNVLYELDGKPALALYQEYLGERATGLPATGLLFPLSIRQDAEAERQVVRTVLAVDEANQSMTFAGDIPQDCLAQLMRANLDRLVHGAGAAAEQARWKTPGGEPVLAIAISCIGRRLVLGERIEEETEITLDHLPKGTAQVGFYSYGEISPHVNGACELHNQTMTLTTFSEA
jgi:hypothetical protein